MSVRESTTQEVKNALQLNLKELQTNIEKYNQTMENGISNIDKSMNGYSLQMQQHLYDFQQKKRRLFQFDGAKNIFFWLGQATNIGTLILLVYFLFFRR